VLLAEWAQDVIIHANHSPGEQTVYGSNLSTQVAWGLVTARNEEPVTNFLQRLWNDERGQDIAEYAVMLAVILVIVVGTIRLIGSNANNVFSQVGSSIQ
jgi:Flp pilus assembly pilin Flp